MKYLFKAIFALLITIYTMIEAIMIYIGGIFYFIWELKWPKSLWQKTHNARELPIGKTYAGYIYSEHNIFHTIKRRIIVAPMDTENHMVAVIDGKLLDRDDTFKVYMNDYTGIHYR